MKKLKHLISTVLFVLCFMAATPSNAMHWFKKLDDQGPAGRENPNNLNGEQTAGVPINSGILMLLFAGALIGAKVIYDTNKKALKSN